ncbi:hypothetical protein SEUCBS140593_004921 [Sporothrix eucalyptigena]|uniref:Cytochrome P450 n=1 Tax=Sporothrix eucalyptigena TaxID=1812306 RepID=A0ABP0BS48_9PEZI
MSRVSLAGWSCLVLVSIWFVRLLVKAVFSPLAHIPGPWYTRMTRLILKYHILTGRRMYYVHALHAAYGPVVRIAPEEVAVADPAGVAQIHRIGGGFLKGPWYTDTNHAPEPGIFAMVHPKAHAQRRRLFSKAFGQASLRHTWTEAVHERVKLAVDRIREEALGGEADILKWWTLMTTDIMAQLSFGESFHMLELGEKTKYIRVIESALFSSGLRYELPWLYAIARFIPVEAVQTAMNWRAYVTEFGGKAVDNLRKDGSNRNLFSEMLAACDDDDDAKQHLTDLSIRLEAGNLIIAGSDTTANTLTYAVWCVLKRPDLQCRLEAEVYNLMDTELDDATLEKLPLLNAVIDETLRLYGAAPGGLPRTVPQGGATLGGYFVPAGYVVETQAYTAHRDPNIWRDPLSFDESRFLDPATLTKEQKLAFSPFGAGTRICLGIHLARIELRLALAMFFSACRGTTLSPSMTDDVMEMQNYFLIAPRGHRCNISLPSNST